MDVSNTHDLMSLGARLQSGHQVAEAYKKGLLESHNLGALCTLIKYNNILNKQTSLFDRERSLCHT